MRQPSRIIPANIARHYPRVKDLPLGFVVYEGPSAIDGANIAVIVTGIFKDSANSKTGNIVQTFIIRTDVSPTEALKTGQDVSICGQCEHRPALVRAGNGKAPCYVNVGKSVLAVFRAYQRGRYVRATPEFVAQFLTERVLRLGTYGDPAAAYPEVWRPMVAAAAGHTGYSHQWQSEGFDVAAWAPMVMASADTEAQQVIARAMGMRSFRVSVDDTVMAGEIRCPASAEAGRKATCSTCKLCAGSSIKAKNIVIQDHAVGHKARRVISITAA
jgi:hypothetical protein